MGASLSGIKVMPIDGDPHSSSIVSFTISKPLSTPVLQYAENIVVSPAVMSACNVSWKRLIKIGSSEVGKSSYTRNKGFHSFCEIFFTNFVVFDAEGTVVPKFVPLENSDCFSRNALLMKIVSFCLSFPSSTSAVKAKLKAIGSSRCRVGISDFEFCMFAEVLLCTIATVVHSSAARSVLKDWSLLLSFVVSESRVPNEDSRPRLVPAAKAIDVEKTVIISARVRN